MLNNVVQCWQDPHFNIVARSLPGRTTNIKWCKGSIQHWYIFQLPLLASPAQLQGPLEEPCSRGSVQLPCRASPARAHNTCPPFVTRPFVRGFEVRTGPFLVFGGCSLFLRDKCAYSNKRNAIGVFESTVASCFKGALNALLLTIVTCFECACLCCSGVSSARQSMGLTI